MNIHVITQDERVRVGVSELCTRIGLNSHFYHENVTRLLTLVGVLCRAGTENPVFSFSVLENL